MISFYPKYNTRHYPGMNFQSFSFSNFQLFDRALSKQLSGFYPVLKTFLNNFQKAGTSNWLLLLKLFFQGQTFSHDIYFQTSSFNLAGHFFPSQSVNVMDITLRELNFAGTKFCGFCGFGPQTNFLSTEKSAKLSSREKSQNCKPQK